MADSDAAAFSDDDEWSVVSNLSSSAHAAGRGRSTAEIDSQDALSRMTSSIDSDFSFFGLTPVDDEEGKTTITDTVQSLEDDEETSADEALTTASTHQGTISPQPRDIDDFDTASDAPDVIQVQEEKSDSPFAFIPDYSSEFDDETVVKTRRAIAIGNPNLCHGRTRRQKCSCTSCRRQVQGELHLNHIPLTFGDSGSTKGVRMYPVTAFDMMDLPRTMNKSENWKLLRQALEECAATTTVHKAKCTRQRDLRLRESFDVEIIGNLVTAQIAHQHLETVNSSVMDVLPRRSRDDLKAWKHLKEGVYYSLRSSTRSVGRFTSEDAMDLHSCVRPMRMPMFPAMSEEEVYLPSRCTFYSRLTKQEATSHLRTDMLGPELIENELKQMTTIRQRHFECGRRESYYSCYSLQDRVVRENHSRCWASTASQEMDYDEWYLEMDFSENRHVSAVVMQGRAPELECFPTLQSFTSRAQADAYGGPVYPTIRAGSDKQWVERVEISARWEQGQWFSLGQFRANDDAFSPVRIDLPLGEDVQVRYLRIRPLSKAKGGYHGDKGPAMRCAVVGNQSLRDKRKAANVASQRTVNDGMIRYDLYTPDEKVEGFQEKSKYVSGLAETFCGTGHHHDALIRYNTKRRGARYQKKKLIRAMMGDEDTYDDA